MNKAYRLDKCEYVKDIDASVYEYKHIKSGADIIYIETEDINKVFTIGFKTVPFDDSGVFHILEHTVLSGSERYPLKDPFVQLLKSSLQSYMNAFTSQDKTQFVFSTPDETDFMNLLKVFADGVFCPGFYDSEYAFMQEGWHIEKKGKELSYNGVVYNEMKGAESDIYTRMEQGINKALFPDTGYAYESGGNPEFITDLTYEKFLEIHSKYYVPCNCVIYLYGKLHIGNILEYLDENYLSLDKYEAKRNMAISYTYQKPVDNFLKLSYESGSQDADDVYYQLGFCTGRFCDNEKNMALSIICDALADKNSSPLKRAVLDSKLAMDLDMSVSDEMLQPALTIEFDRVLLENCYMLKELTFHTIENIVNEGFDKELLLALINNYEFNYREMDTGRMPKGIIIMFSVMADKMYGGDCTKGLKTGEIFKSLREKVNTGYFENLLREVVLENPHRAAVILTPSESLLDDKERREKNKLKKIWTSMSQAEKKSAVKKQKQLKKWQKTPDKEEMLKKIPCLSLNDIKRNMDYSIYKSAKEIYMKELLCLAHEKNTRGIAYIRYYFDFSDMEIEDIKYLSTFLMIYGYMPTLKYSLSQLEIKKKALIGRFTMYTDVHEISEYETINKISVEYSCLVENLRPAMELMAEIINNGQFVYEEIYSNLKQSLISMEDDMVQNGSLIAAAKARSELSLRNLIAEKIGNMEYYSFLKDLVDNFDKKGKELIERFKSIREEIFIKERLTVSITGDMNCIEKFRKSEEYLGIKGNRYFQGKAVMKFENSNGNKPGKNTGFIPLETQVAFAAVAFKTDMRKPVGTIMVFKKIAELEYLWENVRVRTGAYDVAIYIDRNGIVTMTSYRDPAPAKTVRVFENTGRNIKKIKLTEKKLERYIISALAPYLTPVSPNLESVYEDGEYFGEPGRKEIVRDILNVTQQDIQDIYDTFDRNTEKNTIRICIAGNTDLYK